MIIKTVEQITEELNDYIQASKNVNELYMQKSKLPKDLRKALKEKKRIYRTMELNDNLRKWSDDRFKEGKYNEVFDYFKVYYQIAGSKTSALRRTTLSA